MDSSNAASSGAAVGLAAVGIMVYLIFIFGLIALFIWFYWRIFTKAGFNGALSLLNLIPGVGQLVCIIILAFGRWPIEDALAASGGRPVPPSPMPPSSPPGSTLAQG